MSKNNFIEYCSVSARCTKMHSRSEVNLFCEILGYPKSQVNRFIGDDPHGVVDIMEGYRYFSMTEIHAVISEYEHWMEIYKTNEELRKAVDAWYYYCQEWHEKHSYEEPRWVSVKDKMPKENDAVLVRGEMKNNGHADEFYVFLVENGEFVSATSGRPIKEHDGFKDYTFTHWKPIITPKQEAKRSKGCPNLRSWLAGCPVDGLREETPEYLEEQRKAQETAHQRVEECKQALYQAIEEEVKQ